MKYVLILDGQTVHEIQPDKDPLFKSVPIAERFSVDYLSHCIAVKDSEKVEPGWLYDAETKSFSTPPVEESVAPPVDPAPLDETPPPSVLEELESKIQAQNARIAALESGSLSLFGKLSALETTSATLSSKLGGISLPTLKTIESEELTK